MKWFHQNTNEYSPVSTTEKSSEKPPPIPPPTKLPFKSMMGVFMPILAGSIIMTLHLPFVKFMVIDFGIKPEDSDAYVGILTGIFFIGRALGSFFWGRLSDTSLGKAKVMVINLFGISISSILFGLSPNMTIALTTRFFSGFLNGVTAISRVIVAEICDDSNIGNGMNVVTTASGFGIILGPAIGGMLSFPAKKYPDVFRDTIFDTFEYLLPCVVAAVISFISVFFVWKYLNQPISPVDSEDAASNTAKNDPPQINQSHDPHSNHCQPGHYGTLPTSPAHQNLPNLIHETPAAPPANLVEIHVCASISEATGGAQLCEKPSKFQTLLKNKAYCLAIFAHGIDAMMMTSFDVVFNLWCLSDLAFRGLQMDTAEIGLVLSWSAGFYVLAQLFIYPILVKKVGSLVQLYLISKIFLMILSASFGLIAYLKIWGFSDLIMRLTLVAGVVSVKFLTGTAFTLIAVLVCNSITNKRVHQFYLPQPPLKESPPKHLQKGPNNPVESSAQALLHSQRAQSADSQALKSQSIMGYANGMNGALGEVFRAIGPIVLSRLYVECKRQHDSLPVWITPFTDHLVFLCIAGLFGFCYLAVKRLPPAIEKKK